MSIYRFGHSTSLVADVGKAHRVAVGTHGGAVGFKHFQAKSDSPGTVSSTPRLPWQTDRAR
jgi:hypothetical protein